MTFGASSKSSKSKTTEETSSESKKEGSRTEQLILEQEAVDKIIADVLGGVGGLAEIFAGEQNVGLFNSSVSAQAAGDLAANLAGEIAKITGKTEIRSLEDIVSSSQGTSTTTGKSKEIGFSSASNDGGGASGGGVI
jgi:hypothetical protein